MEWMEAHDDTHEEAREEGQENFGEFVTEKSYLPISFKTVPCWGGERVPALTNLTGTSQGVRGPGSGDLNNGLTVRV